MFLDTKQLNLDSKHRLMLPSLYRDRIKDSCGGQMVLMPSLPVVDQATGTIRYQNNLWLYKVNEFERVAQGVLALPENSLAVRELRDRVLGQAVEVSLDAGGRIVIPAELRAYARIDKGVRLVGAFNKFVVWSEYEYEHRNDDNDGQIPPETLTMMSALPS